MSILCKCDRSAIFPRCNRNDDYCPKVAEDKKQEDTSLAVHLFKDNVCKDCGLKQV